MTSAVLSRRAVLAAAGAVAASGACARPADGEAGDFRLSGPRGRGLRVGYFVPGLAHRDSQVVMVLHGQGRDALDYRDAWRGLASRLGFIVVTPEFDEHGFEGSRLYNQGGVQDEDGDWRAPHLWSFQFVERAFDAFVQRTGSRQSRFGLYGHSAGAQFVHRFMLFMPAQRVSLAVAANAGWYTQPTRAAAYPYGLAGAPISDAVLRAALAKPLTVLLGDEDDDPREDSLRRTAGAMAQGPHRVARGMAFIEAGRRAAAGLGAPFAWRLRIAPGVDHDHAAMARAAAPLLAGAQRIASSW